MAKVVHLKWGEAPPTNADYLMVTHVVLTRGDEFFVEASPSLHDAIGGRLPHDGPGYPSLEAALKEAQRLSDIHGVGDIYVQHESVLVRPFYPGTLKLP